MQGQRANLQALATDFGRYGEMVNTVYRRVAPHEQHYTWAQAQADLEADTGIGVPPNYETIHEMTCWVAVFLTAAMAGYITLARAETLRRLDFGLHPLRGYQDEGTARLEAQQRLVRGKFREDLQPCNLYWFFRRQQADRRADLLGQCAHVMFALDGRYAAGSNNALVVFDDDPPLQFATHDLNAGLGWVDGVGAWLSFNTGVYLDIVRTSVRILRPPEL